MLKFLERLRGRQSGEVARRAETFDELVERLAADEADPSEKEVHKAAVTLNLAGRTVDELQAAVDARRERMRLEATIATEPEWRRELLEADQCVADCEQALREIVAELQGKLSAANERRRGIRSKLATVADAQDRIREAERAKPEHVAMREKLRSLAHERFKYSSQLERLPTFDPVELARLRAERDELQAALPARVIAEGDGRILRLRELAELIDQHERGESCHAKRANLERAVAEIDRQVAALKAGNVA